MSRFFSGSFKQMFKLPITFSLLTGVLALTFNTYPKDAKAAPLRDFYIQQALDRYFPLPSDARSLALGGSSDTSCSGSICTYLNPSGLGKQDSFEISISASSQRINGNEFVTHESFEQTENRGYILLATPLGEINNKLPEYGTLSFGYSRYKGETNDTISSTPDGHTRTLAYGYNANPELNLGYTFTFYDDQLNSKLADLHSHARILHLFGIQFALSDDTILGSTFKLGAGQSDTEDYVRGSNGLSKPREYSSTIGISKKYEYFRPSLSINYGHIESSGNLEEVSPQVVIGSSESGDFYAIRSGLEYLLSENFTIRCGLRWSEILNYDFNRSDLSQLNGSVHGIGWSAGAGYNLSKNSDGETSSRIDYGIDYLTSADGQWEHRLSITLPFA